ncbi:MAG: hypothetical protein HUU35_15380 [Armatimonadetes bacterium]|nr:hypothetical protein [Armatimonadota bacterium]
MTGLVLEGIPGVGKSRLLAALRELPEFQARPSTLVLAEHYTERAIETAVAPAAVRYERLMYRVLSALEPLRVMTVEGRVFGAEKTRLRYVLERFHLSNVVLHAAGDRALLRRVENTLRLYHPSTLLLLVEPSEIEARLEDSLARRNTCWRDYLFRHGRDLPEVAEHFARQQEAFQALAADSSLPVEVLDMSATSLADAARLANELLDQPCPASA